MDKREFFRKLKDEQKGMTMDERVKSKWYRQSAYTEFEMVLHPTMTSAAAFVLFFIENSLSL